MDSRGLAALGLVLIVTGWSFALPVGSRVTATAPQAKPEGEMRWALYVPLSPVWFDPGEVGLTGLSAFWVLYAYDPAKAKQLLAEAGYPRGFDAGELQQVPPISTWGKPLSGIWERWGSS